ncbi:MAG: energy transducer TonB [Bacteroidales bacterium]|nr:energy transducer TonB [Bacteroidales bacterium]
MKKITIFIFLILPLMAISQSSNTERFSCHEDSILAVADKMPEFPGGDIALRKFIATNIHYPVAPVEEVNIGKTYVKFCINRAGAVERIKVVRSIHPKFDKEAIRVVKSFPNWIPGKKNGKLVCVWYTIPINVHWKED